MEGCSDAAAAAACWPGVSSRQAVCSGCSLLCFNQPQRSLAEVQCGTLVAVCHTQPSTADHQQLCMIESFSASPMWLLLSSTLCFVCIRDADCHAAGRECQRAHWRAHKPDCKPTTTPAADAGSPAASPADSAAAAAAQQQAGGSS